MSSKKFPNYQTHIGHEGPEKQQPLGFSGLPTRTKHHKTLPKKSHHKTTEDWVRSPSVSNIEQRVISALLFFDEFRNAKWNDPDFHDLTRSEVHGVRLALSRFKYFLLETEEAYGRMSRRRAKALDVLQHKEILNAWENRLFRSTILQDEKYSPLYREY